MSVSLAEHRLAVADAWDKAEHAIKLAEQVNGQVVNPAIYELRYAGRRLIEADQLEAKGDLEEAAKRLGDAQMDCMRARHDAVDAATSKITVHLELAIDKLGASREYPKLCVSDLAHAVFRYGQASKRPANIMAS